MANYKRREGHGTVQLAFSNLYTIAKSEDYSEDSDVAVTIPGHYWVDKLFKHSYQLPVLVMN